MSYHFKMSMTNVMMFYDDYINALEQNQMGVNQ